MVKCGHPAHALPAEITLKRNFGYHYCDTKGGNSGSSVLTADNVALGIHGYGFTNSNGNAVISGACLMQGSHYDDVYEWSGLGKSLPDKCSEYARKCTCEEDYSFTSELKRLPLVEEEQMWSFEKSR
jgi:hypothetical protein